MTCNAMSVLRFVGTCLACILMLAVVLVFPFPFICRPATVQPRMPAGQTFGRARRRTGSTGTRTTPRMTDSCLIPSAA